MQPETLEMEIKYIRDDIEETKADIKEIKSMFNKLDDRYPTRREFNAVKWILWIAISAATIITTILQYK